MSEHTVVLVTGSMRSGTSSLAGSLKHLGLARPAARGAGVPAQRQGPLRAALGDRVPQAAAARRAGPAQRRQPAGRGAGRGAARGRHRRGRAERLAGRASPSRGSWSRTRTPPGCCRPVAAGRRAGAAATCGCSPRCGTRPRWSARRTSPGARAGAPTPSAGSRRPPTPPPGSTSRWSPSAARAGRPARVPAVRRPARRLAHRPAAGLGPARPRPARSTRTAGWTSSSTPACGAPS